MARATVLFAFALTAQAACILNGHGVGAGAPNDYAGAAVFAASAVGATAVNRELTGECYAACTPGHACNRKTGLCEPIACHCPADLVCEIVGGDKVCVHPRPGPDKAVDSGAPAATVDASAPRDAEVAPAIGPARE